MSRGKRILLVAVVTVVIFIIAAALILPAWIDPNQYRDMVEARLQETLGREVSIGDIRLKVLPVIAVSVEDVAIHESPPGSRPFVEADAVRGSMKLLPLLRRKFEIRKVSLEKPRIHLVRNADGSWNFDSLAAALAGGDAPEEEAAEPGAGGFEVSRFGIDKATLSLEDRRTRPGEVIQLELRDLDLEVRDFRLGDSLRYRIGFSLPPHDGGTIASSGSLGLTATAAGYPFDAEVEIRDLDPQSAGPYLREFLDLEIGGGSFSLGAAGKGTTAGAIEAAGRIALEDVTPLLAAATGHRAAAPLDLEVEFDLAMSESHDRFEFRNLELESAGSGLQAKGTVDLSGDRAHVDVDIPSSRLQVDDLKQLLGALDTELPLDISSPDPIEIACRFRGHPDAVREADLEGSLRVSRLTLRHPSLAAPMQQVNGRLELSPNRFAVREFSATLGSSDMSGELEVENFDAPVIRFGLRSRQARLGELMSFATPAQQEQAAADAATQEETADWNEYLDRMTATGTLEIEAGSLDRLAFTGFTGTMNMKGRRIRFDPLGFQLYGGRYDGAAEVDLGREPAPFRLDSRLQSIDVFTLLADNIEVKDLRGTLSGNLEIGGTLQDYEQTVRGVSGGGEIRIVDGSIAALNVLEMLSKVSGVFGETTVENLSRKIASEGTEFSSLSGHLQVAQGTVRSDDLALRSPDVDLAGAGTLRLLDGGLDMKIQVLLSEAVSGSMRNEGSRAAEVFWNSSSKRVEMPLKLAGTVDAPAPSVDYGKASETLVRSKVDDFLRRKLGGGDKDAPAAPTGGAGQQAAAPAATDSGTTPAEGSAGSTSGLTVEIRESRLSGNFLIPDLKISGRFLGANLSHASLRLSGAEGKEILFEENAFPEIAAAAAAADTPMDVAFHREIDGKRILGSTGGLEVVITLFDTGGGSTTARAAARR